jgi:hypothetical protein
MSSADIFRQHGAIHLARIVPQDVCKFMTHILMLKGAYGVGDDDQVPGSFGVGHGEMACETLLDSLWPLVEDAVGEELIPTYSYARLYVNGNTLEKHTDRPSCEVSVTIQLGRSHHYAWPIYMGERRYDLGEGDGVIYSGCDVEHWRDRCDGPPDYYSGQVFLHYVRAKGRYAEFAGDRRWGEEHPFVRNRVRKMYNK